jgi:hypothetical protein
MYRLLTALAEPNLQLLAKANHKRHIKSNIAKWQHCHIQESKNCKDMCELSQGDHPYIPTKQPSKEKNTD